MPDNNLERLVHKNLLYIIKASIGSEIFRHVYVKDTRDGRTFDALADGSAACAYMVSGVLALVGLIDHPHATVTTTVRRMQELGWVVTSRPQPGDVVQWGVHNGHEHMAFYVGGDKVIGNSTANRVVAEYGLHLEDGREPLAYYTHPTLREKEAKNYHISDKIELNEA